MLSSPSESDASTRPRPRPARRPHRGHDHDGPRDRRRLLGRQPSLPAGRAIVGGLLVTVAAIGTFAAYTNASAGPTRSYVVAAASIRAGQRLTPENLRLVPVDLPDDIAGQAFTSAKQLEGATALAPVEPNQLIAPSAVRQSGQSDPASSRREFSFALDRDKALDGQLQRGELVDLVATYGSGNDSYTAVVARRARVVDAASGKASVGSSGKVTLTVTVESDRNVLEAAHAIEVAKVRLVRTTEGDEQPTGVADERFQPEAPGPRTGGSVVSGPTPTGASRK